MIYPYGLEVRVAWQDRTLFCRYFTQTKSIVVGGRGADIQLPIFSSSTQYQVMLPYHLKDGEEARVKLHGGLLDLYIRPLKSVPQALAAPFVDMSSSEVTGAILAIAVTALLGLYMNIYTPSVLLDDESAQAESIQRIKILFKMPKLEEPATAPIKTGANAPVKTSPAPKPEANAAPPRAILKPSPAKKAKPSPLNTFGGSGFLSKLQKDMARGGDLTEAANQATGQAGNSQGQGFEGTTLKETGSGRDGNTVGIGDGPGGTGRGKKGLLAVGGLGTKETSPIQVSEQGASQVTGMDREAIRRVIREHIREIRSCYEHELQAAPDLYGKVVLEWDITEGGRVARAIVSNNGIGNSKIGECLVAHLRSWKFPDPPANQIGRVVYPFIFSSR